MSTKQNAPDEMTPLDSGEHEGIAWAIVDAPMEGAINGYVRIPESHPWHGLGYSDTALNDVEVHGGLTYGDGEWIGFDTLHAGDVWPGSTEPRYADASWSRHWSRELVIDETKRLAEQVAASSSSLGDFVTRATLDTDVAWRVDSMVGLYAERGVGRPLVLASLQRYLDVAAGAR